MTAIEQEILINITSSNFLVHTCLCEKGEIYNFGMEGDKNLLNLIKDQINGGSSFANKYRCERL